ncbi:MAG: polysulfide reductase NrfD [Desulfobacteraceae bacterium]|nr:polysulfide reductase NrfD [Desulfobacteraceae bacterium]
MALRQWMVTHEWMVKPTPQTEWIERRGVLVWIAEVFTSLGAGLYLVSLFFDNWWGMLISWIIIMFLKVPLHIIYFGKPLRFWRTLIPITDSWKTSWFTRGINFTIYFGSIVFIQLVVTYLAVNVFPGTAWGTWDIVLRVFGGIFAFLVGIYSGFIMSYCKSVPFWNSAMLPLILIFAGVADGFALMLAVGMSDTSVDIMAIEFGSRILLTVNAVLITAYLWNATYTLKTAKYSALLILKGNLAVPFWVGVIALGIIIPLAISVSSLFAGEASAPLLIAAVVSHTIGAVALKYVLLKAGVHNPILPVTTSTYH